MRLGRVLVGVECVAPVGLDIAELGRADDQERHQPAVDDRDVDRVDAGQAVAADRREQPLARCPTARTAGAPSRPSRARPMANSAQELMSRTIALDMAIRLPLYIA